MASSHSPKTKGIGIRILRTPFPIPSHQTTIFVDPPFLLGKNNTPECPQSKIQMLIYTSYIHLFYSITFSKNKRNKMSFCCLFMNILEMRYVDIVFICFYILCKKYQQKSFLPNHAPSELMSRARPTLRGKRTHWHIAWTSEVLISVDVDAHRIHVWYIYLHLVDFYGKCREIYHTWSVWVKWM